MQDHLQHTHSKCLTWRYFPLKCLLNVIHILKLHLLINFNQSFHKHLLGRRHARTILEKQGKELDVEEFKNFSMVSGLKNLTLLFAWLLFLVAKLFGDWGIPRTVV